MTPLAPVFLALLCSILGTTTELIQSDHRGLNQITTQLRKHDKSLAYLAQPRRIEKRRYDTKVRSKRETNDDARCAPFEYKEGMPLTHPRSEGEDTYSNNTKCFTTIYAGERMVVVLTFVDQFEMEDPIQSDPPICKHDYLEIRDGQFGYARPVYRFCGKSFPPTVVSTGPYLWLKFKSDGNVQYSGFKINVEFQTSVTSNRIPDECFKSINSGKSGVIDSIVDGKACRDQIQPGAPVDIQWNIVAPPDFQIYLNFTNYKLAKPNECDSNIVQVFGAEPHFDFELGSFCGSVPNSLTTKKPTDNVMYVRMFSKDRSSNMSAQFTAFRARPIGEEIAVKCNHLIIYQTGLGSDEENDPHMILAIFSVIFSVLVAVFLFKCVMKIYRDQKQINDLLKSNDGTLGKLSQDNLSYDPLRLTRDSEPRASLDRENQTNEIYKQQRRRRSSSIDSDFIRSSMSPELNNGDWPESIPILENIRIEHKGRTRRLDSKKDESIRSLNSNDGEHNEDMEETGGDPDTQEFGCQTRDSLFQTDPPSSNGTNSGRHSRRLSEFRHSGATGRAPAPVNASQIVIEPIGALPDRRPMSSETTRSAPDVIIVSKPVY